MENVQLTFYQPEHHYEALKEFHLPEDQEQFTALPLDALKKCEEDPERYPIVILQDQLPVGFFVLHKGENIQDFIPNPNGMLIRALSIDLRSQGKGYAKIAMLQLPEFVSKHFPEINELVLAVNFKNVAAQKLYKKAGFQDKGMRKEGPIGPQYVLHYDLSY